MSKTKKPIIETHGKIEDFEPTTLDQIFGYNQLSRYNTDNVKEYEVTLAEMNRAELENEARRVGTFVSEQNEILKNHLIKEFNSYINAFRKPKHVQKQPIITKEMEAILKEGR